MSEACSRGCSLEAVLSQEAQLIVRSPHAAELVLIRDGTMVARIGDHRAWSLPIAEPGVYRIELLIDDRFEPGTKRPWAYTNPIYVRAPESALSDVASPP